MEISLRGRPSGALVVSVVVAVLVAVGLPAGARAQSPTADPPDTIGIIKSDESPSNAEIAVRLSEATPFAEVSTVVVGRDDEFADSLASGVLQSESPLLLVPSQGPVPDRVREELGRLGPDRVLLLGGEAAIAPAVADELAQLGYAVERRAGASRFETATAIAGTDASTAATAILARAFPSAGATDPTQGFADALAAGGMAAEMGWPVLLTQTEVLTGATRDYLRDAGITEVKLMGGTAAISQAVEDELVAMGIATERLAGGSRAETAVEVAKERGAESAADAAHVLLVQGQTADAWAGGFAAAAHSAVLDAPIVLAVETQLPPATTDWLADGAQGGGGAQAFAVDPSDGGPVLTCVTVPALCEDARLALGLPPAQSTGITFDPPPGSTVDASQPIRATFAAPVDGSIQYGGSCLSSPGSTPAVGTTLLLSIDIDIAAGACTFTLTFTPQDGQQTTVDVGYQHTGASSIALLSRTSSGAASGGSEPSASRDGSVVAYIGEDPGTGQLHSYVNAAGRVELLDVTPQGTPGSGPAGVPPEAGVAVSADGGHVAFVSADDTLDPDADLGANQFNLYVRDLATRTTRHVSVDITGTPVSRGLSPSLSGDGQVVAYTAQGETGREVSCACTWFWWRDLQTGEIGFVQTPDGQPVDGGGGSRPQLSADGQTIAFQTHDPLVPADDNDTADVYVYEIPTGTLELVSVAPDGTAGSAEDRNANPETGISGDGRHVVFTYSGGDLVAGEDAGRGQTYLRDREAGTTVRLSPGVGQLGSAAGRPQISDDGGWVVFASDRALLAATQGHCGVYRFDVANGILDRVDLGALTEGNINCPTRMDVAADGSVIFDNLRVLHLDDDHLGPDVYRSAPSR